MAGLVDYGGDSDRESNSDSPNQENPSVRKLILNVSLLHQEIIIVCLVAIVKT